MTTRILSAGLWLLTALYAGSMLHGIAGTHEAVGPVLGLTSAGLILARPLRRPSARGLAVRTPAAITPPRTLSGPV